MAPDLWPFLQSSLQARASIPTVAENSIYKVEPTAYAPIALNAGATNLSPATNINTVTLPFSVSFYGTSYSTIGVSSQGYIAFDPAAIGTRWIYNCLSDRPHMAPPQRALLAFQSDLTSTTRYGLSGAAPNRVAVIEWQARYNGDPGGPLMTFQAQLFENGAPPLVMHESVVPPPAPTGGGQALSVSIGTDSGDAISGDFTGNYTVADCGTSTRTSLNMSNSGIAFVETAGPATATAINFVPGIPLVGETGNIEVAVTAGGLPVVGGGAVQLTETSTNQSGTATVDANGVARFAFPFVSAQPYSFVATFLSGDAPHYRTSTATSTITPVMALQSSIDFSIDVEPGNFTSTRPATWTAVVTAPERTIVDGSVRFSADGVIRGTIPVTDGRATLRAGLADGVHSVTVTYLPVNPLIIGSSVTRTIDTGAATVAVEPFVLQNEWLVAQVSAAGNVTSGSVAFTLDGEPVGETSIVPLAAAGSNNITGIAVIAAPPMVYPPVDGPATVPFNALSMNATVGAQFSGTPTNPPGSGSQSLTLNRSSVTPFAAPTAVPTSTFVTSSNVTVSGVKGLQLVASTNVSSATGRMLFFVDGTPVGVTNVVSNTTTLFVPASATKAHTVRASYLGVKTSQTSYLKPSSATINVGAFTKAATTTSYELSLGTRVGQPVWTVRANVTTPSNASISGGTIVVSDPTGVNTSAVVDHGAATVTFVTPPATTNNQTILSALNVSYSGSDFYQPSSAAIHGVSGYPTNVSATAVNGSGGTDNPDYKHFDTTLRMQTYENVVPGSAGGSLQIRNGEGGELLADQAIDWVLQTRQTLTSPRQLPLTQITYSGQVWQTSSGNYSALMPSGAYVQHPLAQARMTQFPSETEYEWITLSNPLPVLAVVAPTNLTGVYGPVTFGDTVPDSNGRCDDCAVELASRAGAIIPWKIRFLNNDYAKLYVNSNGLLSFKNPILSYIPSCPPLSPTQGPLLAGFWADHDTRSTGNVATQGGMTRFQVTGTAPQRVAVFEWDSVNFYPLDNEFDNNPATDDRASFQIHLFEDNRPPRVVLRNGPKTLGTASAGQYPTIGVDYGTTNPPQADLLQCTNNAAVARTFVKEAYQFQLALTNTQLSLEPSESPAYATQPLILTGQVDVGGSIANGVTKLVRTSSANGTPVTLTGIPGVTPNETVYSDTPPTPGNYSYTFSFNRSAGEPYGNASITLVVPVIPAPPTRTTLNITPTTLVYGAPMQMTAQVVNVADNSNAPNAAVRFSSGNTTYGSVTSSNGTASLTIPAPGTGTLAVTATYAPGTIMTSTTTAGVSVSKRPVLLTIAPATVSYGAMLLSVNISGSGLPGVADSGFVGNDSATNVAGIGFNTPRTQWSPVGDYPLNVTAPLNPNYGFSTANSTVTVTAAGLTAKAPTLTKVFGAPLPPLNSSSITYLGFIGNDSPAIITTRPVLNTSATQLSPVGSYPILISGGVAPNYTLGYVDGTLNVTPGGVTVTADNQTKVYGARVPPLTATYSGFVGGDTEADLDVLPTISTNVTASTPVGAYPILVTGGSDANYSIARFNGTLNVTPATLLITANPATKVYGDPLPPFSSTFDAFVNGDTEASLDVPVKYSTPATLTSPVGGYPVTPSTAKDANYDITFAPGNLSVTSRPLTVMVDSKTRKYGDANPIYTGIINGAVASDSLSVSYIGNVSPNASAGSYPITAVVNDPLHRLGNYSLNITDGALTVTDAPLTVSVASQTRPYGQPNGPFNVSVNGVTAGDGITATASTIADESSAIGTYPIKITLNDPNNRLSNYDVTIKDGTLTVSSATLTVTADDAVRKYGVPNPPFTGSIVGARSGDNITATYFSNATPASPIGAYPIVPTLDDPLHVLGNYTVSINNGSLNVAPVLLTVTVDDASRQYGDANPRFTGNINGIQNADDITATYGTMADESSSVGSYAIKAKLFDPAGVLGNYSLNISSGTLTITQAQLSVVADDKSRTYGAANPPFTGSLTGVRNGDSIAATFFSNTSPASPVGGYPIVSTLSDPANKLGNYAVSTTDGTLTIDPAALTITADNKVKTYGGSVPTLTAHYDGFVNNDSPSVLDVPVTLTTTATNASPTGAYPITPSGAKDRNYAISFVDGSLSVKPAVLVITADDQTATYGSAFPAFTASYDGFVLGETAANLVRPVTLTTSATPASSVGSYAIVAGGATSSNYAIEFVGGTLSIGKATLKAAADNKSKTYGDANPPFTGSLIGVQNGDPITASFASLATALTGIGDYPIVPALADPAGKLGNYNVTLSDGTLTIGKASITVTTDDQSRVYGDANPPFTGSITGVVNNDPITVSYASNASAGSSVGTYVITASVNDPAGKLGNYTTSVHNGVLSIGKAALTVTTDDKSKIYGQANPPLTGTLTGVVNNDPITVSYATGATQQTGAGSYPITATLKDPSGKLNNYAVSSSNGTLTINRAALTITADNKSKVYGAAVPSLTASYDGFVNNDDPASLATPVSLSTSADQTSAAGAYDIVASAAASPNYDIAFVKGTLTINRAALTITADAKSKVYGAALPSLTASYSGLVNGDTPANLDVAPTLATTATAASSVGQYVITAANAVDANYDISYVDGQLDVTRAALTIKADNKSKIYGAQLPALTASYDGFVNGDSATSLATPVALTTSATAASDVNTYPIVASAATSPNYDITFVDGSLTVNKAALTITADHKTKVYGAAMPPLTASFSGFVNGDDEWDLDTPVTLNTTAAAASDAGSYPISVSGATDANYAITFVDGTIDITRAPLTITVNNATKVYGAALPEFSATYSGFVNGDTSAALDVPVTFNTPGTAQSVTGNYPIYGSAASDHNYSISFVDGTLTVTPAPLTITAVDKSKVYGASMPAFTASYSGFVNGDGPASLDAPVSLTSTATALSSVGTYAIAAGGASDANYTISYVPGALTITPANLTITADDKMRVYGGTNPVLTATYSGFVNGDTASSLSPAVVLATAANAATPAGAYTITAAGAANPNYTITFVNGTLTIAKAIVTVTTNNVTKLYGAPNPAFNASYSGFVNGDTASSLAGTLSFATTATTGTSVGTYDVTPSGLTSSNYIVQFAKGTLTITYNICMKSDGTKPAGGTEKVQLQVCDANGQVAGGSGMALTAMKIQTPAGAFVANPAGNGQYSNGLFQYGSVGAGQQGYTFQLRTQALAAGSYDLVFSIGGDPLTHTGRFTVR